MLEKVRIPSVNQLIAYGILMDVCKAREFRIPVLGNILAHGQRKDNRSLRSDASGKVFATRSEAYSVKAERLWNMSTETFKNTNLLKVAKAEAKTLALSLPI